MQFRIATLVVVVTITSFLFKIANVITTDKFNDWKPIRRSDSFVKFRRENNTQKYLEISPELRQRQIENDVRCLIQRLDRN